MTTPLAIFLISWLVVGMVAAAGMIPARDFVDKQLQYWLRFVLVTLSGPVGLAVWIILLVKDVSGG